MADVIGYRTAETVEVGEPLTSRKVVKLFGAINDRVVGMFGSCHWRLFFSVFSMWRAGVNDMVGGQGSPMEDFLAAKPESSRWPPGGLDESAGANSASQIMGNVFGLGGAPGDTDRVNIVPLRTAPGPVVGSLLWKWQVGIEQRGGYDPNTGGRSAPAFDAAELSWAIDARMGIAHGKGYGGYQPAPKLIDGVECAVQDDGFQPLNEEIFFTRIAPAATAGEIRAYSGTCPENPDGVAGVFELARVYIVTFQNPAKPWDVLLRSEWVEGPYKGGGVLRKTSGGQSGRVKHWHLKEFVGAEWQRLIEGPPPRRDYPGGGWDPKRDGFDTQSFLTSQYALAPNLAVQTGPSSLNILAPFFALTLTDDGAAQAAGKMMRELSGTGGSGSTGTAYNYRAGFVLGGLYAQASGLAANSVARVEVLHGITVLDELALTADAQGRAEVLRTYLQYPGVTPSLRFRLKNGLNFVATAEEPNPQLLIECSQILSYRPDREDQYVVMRLASGHVGPKAGKIFDRARATWEDYAASGMVTNLETSVLPEEIGAEGDGTAFVNISPFAEAARELSQEIARLHAPDKLRGYAVEGGKTVLYFARHGAGIGSDERVDLFDGMAAALADVGTIVDGTEYVARTVGGLSPVGTVTYNGVVYSAGQRFIGVAGVTSYTLSVGCNLSVMEWEGIKTFQSREHKKRGESREWVMWPELKSYSVPGGSFDQYGRRTVLNQRCMFGNFEVNPVQHPALNRHVLFGASSPGVSALGWEAPNDYIYAERTNHGFNAQLRLDVSERLAHYASCPVYKAPYQIGSITSSWNAATGEEEVRVEFKTRWQTTVNAPLTDFSRDTSTWDLNALAAEGIEDAGDATRSLLTRSDENGIREYLVKTLNNPDGYGQCRRRRGDTEATQLIYRFIDNIHGSCVPHFCSVQLIPLPYEDNNDIQTGKIDTRAVTKRFIQAEWYLRYICEAFVDQQVSEEVGCALPAGRSGLIDFSYPNLIYRATGGQRRWISPVGIVDRPDKPEGFGPGEVTALRADVFNVYVAAVNLLTKVRLIMPASYETRTHARDQSGSTGVDFPADPDEKFCSPVAAVVKLGAGSASAPVTLVTDWGAGGAIQAMMGQGLDGCYDDLGNWKLFVFGFHTEFRFVPEQDIMWAMLPTAVRALIENGQVGMMGTEVEERVESVAIAVSTENESDGCEFPDNIPPGGAHGALWDGGTGYRMVTTMTVDQKGCRLLKAGEYGGGVSAPAGDLAYIRKARGELCGAATSRRMAFSPNIEMEPYVEVPLL